jgi:hypothetical protein
MPNGAPDENYCRGAWSDSIQLVLERVSLDGYTVLVVEEEPLIALDLQRALEGAGADVVVARNATEALARIGQFDFTAGSNPVAKVDCAGGRDQITPAGAPYHRSVIY